MRGCRRRRLEVFTMRELERMGLPPEALVCILGRSRRVVVEICPSGDETPPKRCTCVGTGEPYPDTYCRERWMEAGGGRYVRVRES